MENNRKNWVHQIEQSLDGVNEFPIPSPTFLKNLEGELLSSRKEQNNSRIFIWISAACIAALISANLYVAYNYVYSADSVKTIVSSEDFIRAYGLMPLTLNPN